MRHIISVSRTYLPSLDQYNKYLKKIWKSNWLTNNGQLVQELENKLKKRFKVKNVVCVSNGTSALILAIRSLGLKGRVYLSPNNFIATVSAPVWEGLKPVFIDYPDKFKSPAIVAHIYGVPNMVDVSPVIYDASHAFAVKVNGKSILSYGDVSIISFNAVKVFQTAEGGAVVTNNDDLADKVRYMRNFGFKTRYSFYGPGVNFKMSEFHAAMGLCSLKNVDKIVKRYKKIISKYNKELGYNHKEVTYYPIWYSSEDRVLKAIDQFEKHNVFPRRYFYPPLNKVFGGKRCPEAEDEMSRVLALPLYYELTDKQQDLVIDIVNRTKYE